MNLFTQLIGSCAIHVKTETPVIIKSCDWYNGELNFDCLVPQLDDKGKVIFCNATYTEKELKC